MARRGPDRPLVICDLGMPRDVDPAIAGLLSQLAHVLVEEGDATIFDPKGPHRLIKAERRALERELRRQGITP